MVDLKINDNPKLYINIGLDKYNGKLEDDGGDVSPKFDKQLEK